MGKKVYCLAGVQRRGREEVGVRPTDRKEKAARQGRPPGQYRAGVLWLIFMSPTRRALITRHKVKSRSRARR